MDLSLSPGHATDLLFHRDAGIVTSYTDFLCIRTPSNPTFWWGNYLLLATPPTPADVLRWDMLFRQLISNHQVQSTHRAYRWLGGIGAANQFVERGFALTRDDCLTCSRFIAPQHVTDGIEIRNYRDDDWDAAIALQVLCREAHHDEHGSLAFRRPQFELYRRMESAGKGARFGAFIGDLLVADLGIYVDGQLGRYNNVSTHPAFRRRGIAAKLVYEAGRMATQRFNLTQCVIVTEADGPNRIYRRLGFTPVDSTYSLLREASIATK